VIVATAGHIDHGKTTLVKALTGVDTDRLPEEKARGISIDLGFAHAALGEDVGPVSFIDVPGHERFIRNMLAGVGAIDAALLVVAADDGVMPQTVEHLHILDLLGVTLGAAVITKADLVDAARLDAVCAEVQALAERTTLAGLPVFAVSAPTGEGLPALRDWLATSRVGPGAQDDGRLFRLAVDRAFTVAGSGTVVTGTVHAGTAAVGDHLFVTPGGQEVRVRGLRVQGTSGTQAAAGQRCALNLSGIAVDQVGRGDWVVHPDLHAPTTRLDARLRVLGGEPAPLAHWTAVHLHLGTADVPARVVVSGEGSIAAGSSAFVQLVAERPLAALHGDRFVIRNQSARRTIGGGTVLDPFAPKRPRRGSLRTAELEAYRRGQPAEILASLLGLTETGVDLEQFARAMNLAPQRASQVVQQAEAFVAGKDKPIGLSRDTAALITARALAALRSFHAEHAQAAGMELAALRRSAAPRLPAAAFQAIVRELANRRSVVLSNDLVRLPEHVATSNPADEQLWRRVQRSMARSGVWSPGIAELAERLQVKEPVLRDFLHRKSRTGEVLRVTADRFCLREMLARLAATAAAVAASSPDGWFTAAQFRDAIGTGRTLAIHYLEFFDRLGITQRAGDRRRMAKDSTGILGPAQPLAAPEPFRESP
jgi:selenocysteine-specific elongation factor